MYLCLVCSEQFDPNDPRITDQSHKNHGGCPGCGHNGIPADTENETVQVSITWHELRVLTIWAERWASSCNDPSMSKTVYGIADRLQIQHMARPGLSFMSEISDLRGQGYDVQQDIVKEGE